MDISIIIVSYNTRELLKSCISSIYAGTRNLEIEILVVDNDSSDGTSDMLRGTFPEVILLANKINVGFASANNQGIKAARGKNILLLNPDTLVKENSISLMHGFLEKKPDAGIVGCSILGADESLQSSTGRFPTLARMFLQSIFLDKVISHIPYIRKYTMNMPASKQDGEIDWATGACLMVRREVIERIGLLDEDYFLYFEEVDLCYRAKMTGYKIYFLAKPEIIHYLAQSTRQDLGKTILESHRSSYRYFKKHYSDGKFIAFGYIMNLGLYLRILLWSIARLSVKPRYKEASERLWAYFNALAIKIGPRIAIDITPSMRSKAGVGHYTANLVQGLTGLNNSRNTYIFLGYRSYQNLKNIYLIGKILTFIRHLVWEQVLLPLSLFIRKIDLLHSPAYELPLLMPCRSVVTIHDMAFWLYPDKFRKFYRWRLKRMVPFAARKADLIITDSRQSQKDIATLLNIPSEKVEVVYLGARDIFRPISDGALLEKVKIKYNIGSHKYILYVGTLEPRKNIANLIRAYHRLINLYKLGYKLVIVGMKGWLYNDIYRVTDELELKKEIVFTDYAPEEDLPFLYNAADLFVYLSIYEGFGLPVLEAMSCGVPTVTSNTSSLPELVGDAAVTVNPYDIDDISRAMRDILTDSRLRLALREKGLLRAKDFNWEKTARNTLTAYERALEDNGAKITYRHK